MLKQRKLSPKWCLSVIAILVMTFSSLQASAHAVQVGYYVLPNGFLRVYIEHWHGDLTTSQLVNNGMSITTTYGSATVTQNVNPTGAVNNTAWNNLPFAGSNITILGTTGSSNRYNDWAYYDFAPAACNVPVRITLNGGLTVVLQEAEGQLWPKTIIGTFNDSQGPTITANNNTASVACGVTGTNVNFSSTVVDNCSQGLTASYSVAPGSFFPVGVTNVTATATDAMGNTTNTVFPVTVSVVDFTAPVISSCPSNISVGNDLNSCGATVTYDLPVYSDNCGVTNITQINGLPSGSQFPVGTTINKFKVTDGSGNAAYCSFTVTVSDNEAPRAICRNLTVALGANESASVTVSDINNGSFDNCSPVTVSISGQTTYSCSDIGLTIPVTLTVTDALGNTSTCVANVTVTDPQSYCNVAPVAVCKSVTIAANGNCTASASATDFDGGSTDADGDVMTFTVFPAGPYALGTTNVTLTVTDPTGASSTCATTITVVDDTAPSITAPASIVLGECNTVNLGSASGSDNCSFVITNNAPATYGVGTTLITWTATDAAGNTSTATQTVTVVAKPAPSIAVTKSSTVFTGLSNTTIALGYGAQSVTLSATGGLSYSWSNGSTSAAITVSPTATTTYTVTAMDQYGCTSTATVTISVMDVRCGNKNDKVLVCHKTGSASNPWNQICVSASAVATHLANGGYLGACSDNATNSNTRTVKPLVGADVVAATVIMPYPNPSQGNFNLQLKGFSAGKVTVQVLNSLGKTVMVKEVNVSYATQDETLNLKGVASGIYQVRVVGVDGVITTTVVIAR